MCIKEWLLPKYIIYILAENKITTLNKWTQQMITYTDRYRKGPCGLMIIVIGNGSNDPSSNPGRGYSHFKYPREMHESNYFPSNYG